jgi:hypothetical protein
MDQSAPDTFQFDDLMGGLTDLKKVAIIIVTVYYTERDNMPSKESRHSSRSHLILPATV